MDVDLSANSLLISLLLSAIGAGVWLYGKRERRLPQMVGGLALLVFPYFVSSALWMGIIGVAIIAGMCGAVRAGL
jgi:hypothetical protein